jgi:hypothetical protein
MRGQVCSTLMFLLLLSAQSRAETACVDIAQLAHSTVGITRYFDEAERNAQSDVVGIHGTAWFQSPTNIVTVGHVATAMGLSTEDWKRLDIKDGADSKVISARIRRWIGGARKLVVLELRGLSLAERCHSAAPLVGRSSRVTPPTQTKNLRFVSGLFAMAARRWCLQVPAWNVQG